MANQSTYGLFQLLDHGILNPNETAATVDSGLLTSGILYTVAQHNADIAAVQRLFCEEITDYQLEVQQQGGTRSQPVDEFGRAIPIKPIAPYTVAFPLIGSGSAMGATYLAKARMTVGDMARTLSAMLRGDYQWVFDHILAALFVADGYAYRDITGKGALTIEGLANGDDVTYYKTTTGAVATDTHIRAEQDAIADATAANPYPIIKAELTEHPDNAGEVVAFIPTNLVATTAALAEFNPIVDPDITLGVDSDRLTGSLDLALPADAVKRGKTDTGVWIVEWPKLPDDYIISIMTRGRRPLGKRVFAEASLRGFKATGTRDDFPYFEEQWQRWEGYGALSRIGAVVYRIGTSDSYTVPTNYESPMR